MLCPATSMFYLTIYLGDYSILVHKEPCHSFFNGFMIWIYFKYKGNRNTELVLGLGNIYAQNKGISKN